MDKKNALGIAELLIAHHVDVVNLWKDDENKFGIDLEDGLVLKPQELEKLQEIAKANGIKLQFDGHRFSYR